MSDLRDQEERQKEHQKGYIKAVNETKITHYDLKEIKSESIIRLKSLLEKEHYLKVECFMRLHYPSKLSRQKPFLPHASL